MNSLTTLNKKQFSSKQEHLVADSLGWNVVSGSGARLTAVGDISSDEWLGECKTHVSSGHPITFNLSVWKKLRTEAAAKFKQPVLVVDDGSQLLSHTWCMFKLNVFDLSNVTLRTFPRSNTINITFKYDELSCQSQSTKLIYSTLYDNVAAGITSFSTFRSLLLGED